MKKNHKELRILYLSSAIPRMCGLAFFNQNLMEKLKLDPSIDQAVIAVNEIRAPKRNYPLFVKNELRQEDLGSYNEIADYANHSGANVFCLQHEFGLFGGFDGIFVVELLKKLSIPIVTFLHTIPILKDSKRRNYRLGILKEICKISSFVIVTAERGRETLVKEVGVIPSKIQVIRHGGPDIPYPTSKNKEALKKKYKLSGRFVVFSYGLLSKNKGYQYGIEAIAKLAKRYPKVMYLILGQSHPLAEKKTGEDMAKNLKKQIQKLRLKKNILIENRYLEEQELLDYLALADIYLIPYLTREQVSSGTLAYALTTGNCIASTPFIYAKEMLSQKRGVFVNFKEADSIAKTISYFIKNPKKIEEIRKRTYQFGRSFTWEKMAEKFIEILEKAASSKKLEIG